MQILKTQKELLKEYENKRLNEIKFNKTHSFNIVKPLSNYGEVYLSDNENINNHKVKREIFIYPEIAINEKLINNNLYTISKKDFLITDNEKSILINPIENNTTKDFIQMLKDEFNINSEMLFNKDKNSLKEFITNFINYSLKTELQNFRKKDIKELFFNCDYNDTTKNLKVKKIIDILRAVGFISVEDKIKTYKSYVIRDLISFDYQGINKKELQDFNNKNISKDLFNLLNIENSINAEMKFKPYQKILKDSGFKKSYYLYYGIEKKFLKSVSLNQELTLKDYRDITKRVNRIIKTKKIKNYSVDYEIITHSKKLKGYKILNNQSIGLINQKHKIKNVYVVNKNFDLKTLDNYFKSNKTNKVLTPTKKLTIKEIMQLI